MFSQELVRSFTMRLNHVKMMGRESQYVVWIMTVFRFFFCIFFLTVIFFFMMVVMILLGVVFVVILQVLDNELLRNSSSIPTRPVYLWKVFHKE